MRNDTIPTKPSAFVRVSFCGRSLFAGDAWPITGATLSAKPSARRTHRANGMEIILRARFRKIKRYPEGGSRRPSPLSNGGLRESRRLSPFGKGGRGILFHTVAWLHLFAPFAYFVVPFSLKAFSLQSIYLSSYNFSLSGARDRVSSNCRLATKQTGCGIGENQ
jgi:hypothetical protein